MEFKIRLTGTRPMIQHNGRLANPLDPYTQQLAKLTGKRKKTIEDYAAIMRIESRGATYETEDGLLGLPTDNVWRSLYDAATAYKRGKDLQRALRPLLPNTVESIEVAGATVNVEDFLTDPTHIFYRSVAVNRNRSMRSRPIVHDWSTVHSFELLDEIIDFGVLEPIFERAGLVVGVGDWRPRYGTYMVEVVDG